MYWLFLKHSISQIIIAQTNTTFCRLSSMLNVHQGSCSLLIAANQGQVHSSYPRWVISALLRPLGSQQEQTNTLTHKYTCTVVLARTRIHM